VDTCVLCAYRGFKMPGLTLILDAHFAAQIGVDPRHYGALFEQERRTYFSRFSGHLQSGKMEADYGSRPEGLAPRVKAPTNDRESRRRRGTTPVRVKEQYRSRLVLPPLNRQVLSDCTPTRPRRLTARF
jgi:hypothetical protein